ncbi:MAG: ABC transporter ATP-binding protein [Acidobacteria bacterium]|nr:ABC transporter ATP-binding protein [Acidobacteriota bacterium]
MPGVRFLLGCEAASSYQHVAADGVSFAALPGEILGYLGPNGSGKTTTVGMVTGLLKPMSGEGLFEGKDIQADMRAYKQRLGYVPEEPALYPYLTGREYLELVARLRHISEGRLGEKIPRLLELLSLPDSLTTIAAYSKGVKQRDFVAAGVRTRPVWIDDCFPSVRRLRWWGLRLLCHPRRAECDQHHLGQPVGPHLLRPRARWRVVELTAKDLSRGAELIRNLLA